MYYTKCSKSRTRASTYPDVVQAVADGVGEAALAANAIEIGGEGSVAADML